MQDISRDDTKSEAGKINVVIFCGGNGAKNIIETLVNNPIFDITAMINAYDDGKSTGYLRRIIPGFLGPSDVRKNMSYLVDFSNPAKRILKDVLEYRFPKDVDYKKALQDLYNIIQQKSLAHNELDVFLKKLQNEDMVKIRIYIKTLLDYLSKEKINFNFDDCSFGNLLLAGAFLRSGNNFNISIGDITNAFGLKGKVLNVTEGENFFLSALVGDGEFLPSEASIVEKRANEEIEEIFLLGNYLQQKELKKFSRISKQKKTDYLRSIDNIPKINNEARKVIEDADIIIYGAGTQNSSLFPTYLTEGFAETIISNKKAKKIFISNIGEDNEIPNASVEDIIDKAVYYLNRKGRLNYRKEDFFDYYFVHNGNPEDPKYVKFLNKYNLNNTIHDNFEKDFSGKHDGNKIAEKIMQILGSDSRKIPGIKKISIVIPSYNEGRYILELLNRIRKVDFSSLGFITEIIFVDDGSTDNTQELIKDIKDIKYIRSPVNKGKGNSVILGVKAATGDVIIIQDSDLEYSPEDIKEMLRVMQKYRFVAVYGSRTLRKGMRARALGILYGKRPGAYWSYYIGGQLLSFITWLLYDKFITDTVTGYKMMNAKLLKSFILRSKGFELDHEITAKILKRGFEIYEIPINYKPRTKEEGKKMKWKDGIIAMKTLLKFRFKE